MIKCFYFLGINNESVVIYLCLIYDYQNEVQALLAYVVIYSKNR